MMDPKEGGGSEKEKEKEKVIKRRNRPVFLRYLERRKTDTIVADDTDKGDINLGTLVRRSQSDKTEYSAKLKGTAANDVPQGSKLWQQLIRATVLLKSLCISNMVIKCCVGEVQTNRSECRRAVGAASMAFGQIVITHTYAHTKVWAALHPEPLVLISVEQAILPQG